MITPRAVADADGRLKVCTPEPPSDIAKSVPVVPTDRVCADVLSELIDARPEDEPAQEGKPAATVRTLPVEPMASLFRFVPS